MNSLTGKNSLLLFSLKQTQLKWNSKLWKHCLQKAFSWKQSCVFLFQDGPSKLSHIVRFQKLLRKIAWKLVYWFLQVQFSSSINPHEAANLDFSHIFLSKCSSRVCQTSIRAQHCFLEKPLQIYDIEIWQNVFWKHFPKIWMVFQVFV